jgi:hypothetical protein
LRLGIAPQQRNTRGCFTFGRCRRIVHVKPAKRQATNQKKRTGQRAINFAEYAAQDKARASC